MNRKAEARRAVKERLGNEGPGTSWRRQIICSLTFPPFRHAYDAVFIPRGDKHMSYYEHCAICGRARSWVSFGNNYDKPGSVTHLGSGTITYEKEDS